jgi:hypothetical protein
MALNNLIHLPIHRRVGELNRPGTIDPSDQMRRRDIVHGLKNDICCLLLGIGGLKTSATCSESLKRRLDLLEETLLQVNSRVDELAALSSKKQKTGKAASSGKESHFNTPKKRLHPDLGPFHR